MKKLFFIFLLLATQLFAIQRFGFGLNVNTNAVEFEAKANMSPFLSDDPIYRNFYADFNLISDNDTLVGLGLYVDNTFYSYQPLSFQVGIRTIFTSYSDNDMFALPILFGFKHKIYMGNLPVGSLGAKILYAPSPLSFQDAKKYLQWNIEAAMQIIENVEIYAGYRNIDTDYESIQLKYNDSGYLGFRFIF